MINALGVSNTTLSSHEDKSVHDKLHDNDIPMNTIINIQMLLMLPKWRPWARSLRYDVAKCKAVQCVIVSTIKYFTPILHGDTENNEP